MAITLGAELAVPWAVDTPVNLHELFQLRPSVLALPPRVLKSFVLQEKKTKTKESVSKLFPSSAEFVVIGGGKGDGTTLRRLVNEGVTPIQIYSTSETSMIAITKKGTWQEESAGKPLSAVDMKIAKDGEILVKSPALMLGYFNLSKTDEEVTSDEGYYPTGDIGSLNETGTLKILGRKKDVFNTPEGSNIFPARIEQLIESLEDVHQVILLGDDYPYICAMVSISGAENGVSTSKDGFLSPGANDELYRKFAPLLQTVNSGLERAEQIIRFYLFSKDFPTSCYQQVQGAKIRRNRREIAQVFSNRITEIYRSEDDLDPSYVPGVERRLRKRI
jgi:long-subunit acyl-CoA synthetase (AMP-forming)